jgi:hypothetical protein
MPSLQESLQQIQPVEKSDSGGKGEDTYRYVFRYGLRKCVNEFVAYGCEESTSRYVLDVVRKHTMWYNCITMLIFVALGLPSVVKNRTD